MGGVRSQHTVLALVPAEPVGPCPDADELSRFVERSLPAAERDDIERHCNDCEPCRDAVTHLVLAFAEPTEAPRSSLPAKGDSLGRFVILDWLGAGSMGAVFSAFDPELDRRVAVKLLPRLVDEPAPGLRRRFLAEARAMASLSHPNVIGVHELGTEDGFAFFAMELIDGATLGDWLSAKPRTLDEIVAAFAAAGRGLAAAHAGGVVHRDFKPHNVLVGHDGLVRVIDFGLARAEVSETRKDSDDPAECTQAGTLLGTPAYMAPEQLRGERSDAAGDQFAFCVALYEAIYGRRPFSGDSVGQLREAIERGLPRPPATRFRVRRRVQRVLARGLSSAKSGRYRSMKELLADLTSRPLDRWGPIAAGVVAVAGIGFGAHGALVAADPSCDRSDDPLADVWAAPQRERLVRDAEAGSASLDVTSARWLARRFDDYADQWQAQHHEACAATIERGEVATDVMRLKHACLDRAKDQLRTLAESATEELGAESIVAWRIAGALPPLTACEDVDALRAGPLPPSAEQTPAVEQIRLDLARVVTLRMAGVPRRARSLALSARAKAATAGYAPLLAEATRWLGLTQLELQQVDEGRASLKDAFATATSCDHDDVAVGAAADLACSYAQIAASHDGGIAWGESAVALAARPSVGLEAKASAHECLGRALAHQGGRDAAIDHIETAIEFERQRSGGESVRMAQLRLRLADSLVFVGRPTAAKVEAEAAAAYLDTSEARSSTIAANARGTVAAIKLQLRDLAGAEAEFRALLPLWRDAVGPTALALATTHANLGILLYEQSRYEDALAEFHSAREIMVQTLEPHHTLLLSIAENSSQVLGQLERVDEALATTSSALDTARGHHPNTEPIVIRLLRLQAALQRSRGDTKLALQTAREGLAACDTPDVVIDPGICVELALLASRSHWTLDEAPDAVAMLDAAVRYHGGDEPLTPVQAKELADVAALVGH